MLEPLKIVNAGALEQGEQTQDPVAQWGELCKWLHNEGAVGFGEGERIVEPQIFQMPGGEKIRGMGALKDIEAGQVLMSIPIYCTMVADEMAEPFTNASWGVRLVAKLIQERATGLASPWRAYLQSLPDRVCTPLDCTDAELAEVQHVPMIAKIERLKAIFEADFQSCPPYVVDNCTQEQFNTMMTIVYSRTFRLDGRRYLIPAVDCLNHHATLHQAEWRLDADKGCVDLVATSSIDAGAQVYATYGDRGNDDFFLHYGFVPSKNMDDDIELFQTAEEAVEWYKSAFLSPLGADNSIAEAACIKAHKAANIEQAAMEAHEAEVAEVERGWKGGVRPSETGFRAIRHGQVDGRLMAALESFKEAGVGVHPLEAVRVRCQEILDAFPTTAEEDAEILSNGEEMGDVIKLLLRFRCSKKLVLLTLIELCNQSVNGEDPT